MTDERLAGTSVERFLDELASDAPTPGGGAAGAIAGATGAAMIAMVARLTMKKKGYEDLDDRMRALVERADDERIALLGLADRDAHAFDGVMAAYKLPKESEEQKAARSAAIEAGSSTLHRCRWRSHARRLPDGPRRGGAAMGNPNAASDGVSGAASCIARPRARSRTWRSTRPR